jgi:hypothetical protein
MQKEAAIMKRILLSVAMVLAVAAQAQADGGPSNQSLSVQGVVRTNVGDLQSANVGMIVSLYATQMATANFYQQTFANVGVQNGYFSVELSGANLAFSVTDAWVGIQVTGDANEMPRQHLTAVPYAFSATQADSAKQADTLSAACSGCVVDSMVATGISVSKINGVLPIVNGGTGASAVEADYNIPTDPNDPNGFKSGFTNYGSIYAVGSYFKDPFSIVHMKGLIRPAGAVANATVMYTLKPGYRPSETRDFGVLSGLSTGGTRPCELVIKTTGEVQAYASCGDLWISLDNISYRATQ